MRFLIVGAGAIGLWLGASLVQAGHDVTVVARGRAGESLAAEGIRVVSAGQVTTVRNFVLAGRVASALALGPVYDAVALAVKAYDVAEAVTEIQAAETAERIPPAARIICFQNGVGSEETAATRLGAGRIVAGAITMPVSVLQPGMIEPYASRSRGIGLAPFEMRGGPAAGDDRSALASPDVVVETAAALGRAGLVVKTYRDHRAMLWSKLLLNILGNASSAILDLPPAAVFGDRQLFRIEYRALCEALAVMSALRIDLVNLPGAPVRSVIPWAVRLPARVLQPAFGRILAGGRGDKMPSLHLDLATGRHRTEVGYLNGAVARYGRETGVATPVNASLTAILEGLIRGELNWEEFRGLPARLLAEVGMQADRDDN